MYCMTFMLTPTPPLFAEDLGTGFAAAGGAIIAAYTAGSLLPTPSGGDVGAVLSGTAIELLGYSVAFAGLSVFAATAIVPCIALLRPIRRGPDG